jgi:hypothetical protein
MLQSLNSKEDVQKAFQELLGIYKKEQQRIITKEEQARLDRNHSLVEETAGFTPQAIIKGIADLQWEVSTTAETLREKMQAELERLDNLRTALTVQQKALKESYQTKIAANALFVLKQEQIQREKALDEKHQEAMQKLREDMQEKRRSWAKEQAEFERNYEERKARMEKERQQELEEYKYQLERKYTKEKDAFEMRKKVLLRKLDDQQRAKEKDWSAREKVLAEHASDFEKYKERVDNFPTELEQKVKDARDKAFRNASRDAKETIELFEKEMEGKKRVAELTIENLEKNIEKQQLEIEQLNAELKAAVSQMQSLSIKALDNTQNAKLN